MKLAKGRKTFIENVLNMFRNGEKKTSDYSKECQSKVKKCLCNHGKNLQAEEQGNFMWRVFLGHLSLEIEQECLLI